MGDSQNNPSRRNLIKAAAVVPFAAVSGSAANSAVTVGLIGTGSRGPDLTSMLAKNTPARAVSLCDLFPEKMEKAKATIGVENTKMYKDFHELLASDVDAVIIATPVLLHPEHFEAAVKAKKAHLHRETGSVDVERCKRIPRWSDSANRKLNITFGFQRRYGQVYQKPRKVFESGAIGSIRLAHAHFIKSEGSAGTPPHHTAARGAESTLTAILGRMAMDARRDVRGTR